MSSDRQATLFCRVSSAKQADNFSHDAQRRLGKEYAKRLGLTVTRIFQVVETASKEALRQKWTEYLTYARTGPEKHVLIASVDRALRNYRDLPEVQDLQRVHGKAVHFFNEGLVLDGANRSSNDLQLGIKAAVAVWYAGELAEKTRRGMEQKARDGQWPTRAPFGYRCDAQTKRLAVAPEQAHWVRRIKQLAAEARWSLQQIGHILKREGFTRYGRPAHISFLHRVVRYTIYAGRFEWPEGSGNWHEGTQEKICDWALHEAALRGLERRLRSRQRTHHLVMAGRIRCACGRQVVFDVKKGGRFTYARCTGVRSVAGERVCPDAEFVPLPVIEEQVRAALGQIQITEEQAEAAIAAIVSEAGARQGDAEVRAALLRGQRTKLAARMQQAYEDKLDGKIEESFWLEQQRSWALERVRLEEQLRAAAAAGPSSYLPTAREVIELGKKIARSYEIACDEDKCAMLDACLSNWRLVGKKLDCDVRSPFTEMALGARTGNWWPFCDVIRTASGLYLPTLPS